MRVILLADVERVGKRGDVKNVKDGYGRNFLIPRKLALVATDENMRRLEQESKKIKIREAREETDAGRLKEGLEKISITIAKKSGEGDVLFGSVTSADIAEALEQQGFTVDKRKIHMEEPIKRLGEYQVPVKLHSNVSAEVKVAVVKE